MSFPTKPFSQACENNKRPILEILQSYLKEPQSVLEMGSGTGQHSVFFSEKMPHVHWHTSDLQENHLGINAWIEDYLLEQPKARIERPFIVDADHWPVSTIAENITNLNCIFTANTFHIMSWDQVVKTLAGVGQSLFSGGRFFVYGPFNYNGKYTSDSNADFDVWLKSQAPWRAIRDFETVCEEAEKNGLVLLEDNAMPANNRLLAFSKQ